ncbi:MDR family MFS transporter [Corynebacterium pseudotuberculosis]|uniref:MDR family MFS transporter n=1 Tax=Corynebacterium pseudotuberculosis TaxID=1719 RepID=UPI00090AC1DE|nr:MDR family MFS transporter [Corynebacterium pseudotuberculosis]APG81210.1 Lincomycin resistance protein [Corynebacterium pseudotuberculosis]WFP67673.1 MDR family MFS transporter [Corynebacterium pseudotuberculosis]
MATSSQRIPEPPQTHVSSKPRVGLILGVVVVAAMIMILNETVLSVALPSIMADFGVTADVVQWLATGFLLTMSVVIPATGFLLQRFTTRMNFLTAVGLFILGTLMCAIAPVFWVLVAGRIVQAMGTAIVLPLLMTMTITLVEPTKRGTMMGINSIVISVAPAFGPTLSGFILNSLSWHWLFWVVIPVAGAVFILGFIVVTNVQDVSRVPFDIASLALSALAFGGIIYGFSTIRELVDAHWPPAAVFLIGLTSLAFFVRRQLRLAQSGRALLDMSPFTIRNFVLSTIVLMLGLTALLGMVNVIPIYLQEGIGVSALTTGLALLPGGLFQGLVSPFIGRIYDRVGPRPLVIPGAVFMFVSMVTATLMFTAEASVMIVVVVHCLFCVGLAFVMTPLMTVSLSSLPSRLYGHGSAIVNTLQQLGGAMGTAVMIGIMTIVAMRSTAAPAIAQSEGTTTAFVAGTVFAGLILVTSLFITPVTVKVHVSKTE